MEYSLARSLDGYSEIYNVPFPHLSADPPIDNVNPGLGQIVNLFETIVPVRGQSQHVLEKKTLKCLKYVTHSFVCLTQLSC